MAGVIAAERPTQVVIPVRDLLPWSSSGASCFS